MLGNSYVSRRSMTGRFNSRPLSVSPETRAHRSYGRAGLACCTEVYPPKPEKSIRYFVKSILSKYQCVSVCVWKS